MISIDSDNLVSLTGHQDSVTGNYINTATVTCSILDGSTETSHSYVILFTITLSYIALSNGNYRGTFSAAQTATLSEGKSYILEFTAVSSYGTLTVHSSQVAEYAS